MLGNAKTPLQHERRRPQRTSFLLPYNMKPEQKFNEPLDTQTARPVVCFSPRLPLISHHTNIGGTAEKETWIGCGQHLPSVFSSIPADQECTCIPKFEKDGVQYPPKVGTGTAQDAGEEGDIVIHDLKRGT
ncbi:hypothetical protein BGAL_0116g00270 [Botrytis galanthina]|uniref:Uncharacterized protein n=1 Tax=Botrytis galanthina TaxID=278940 RepID=A0A4S8R553_9HELO|nr:hypothetical protein BGAL_0116g00270 [Botrytis galanthina]